MINLDKGIFPQIHLQGQQLPFTEEDVGKDTRITAVVRLTSIKYQGYNYNFEVTKIDFPDKELDKGTVKARKRRKEERINITSRPILPDDTAKAPKSEEKYESWLSKQKKKIGKK